LHIIYRIATFPVTLSDPPPQRGFKVRYFVQVNISKQCICPTADNSFT